MSIRPTPIVDVTMSMGAWHGYPSGPSVEEPSASGAGRPSPVLQRKPTSSTAGTNQAGGGTWAARSVLVASLPSRSRRLSL